MTESPRARTDDQLAWLTIGDDPTRPVYLQIYDAVRAAILGRRIRSGDSIPSSRRLASLLGVSRSTVIGAIEPLKAEGYLTSLRGSGTYVSNSLPDPPPLSGTRMAPSESVARRRVYSRRSATLTRHVHEADRSVRPLRPFLPGIPALREFPFPQWNRILCREARRFPPEHHGYREPAGLESLRHEIACHLRSARALRCEANQVIVVAGSQQAFGLIAQVLADAGDPVWMEDPGYLGARLPFEVCELRTVPVPVDDEGLRVDAGLERARKPRLIFVTPSHQVPLGVTMSLSRRLQLLDTAQRTDSWIVEDDYDSEFRYGGRPLGALQGIDRHERVVYVGTFSKVMFPGLRLGYMVVPERLVQTFRTAKTVSDAGCASVTQAAVAAFMREGLLARHVRRMRELYRVRQDALRCAIAECAGDLLEVEPFQSGLHVVGWLPRGVDDRAVSRRAKAAGIETIPLSMYCVSATVPPGLVLGFAPFQRAELFAAARTLRSCILAETG